MSQLTSHDWPGNVRELQNAIERAVILAQGRLLQFDWLQAANTPPAEVATAVDALMASRYGSTGERCIATSVAVAVGRIADELIERLAPSHEEGFFLGGSLFDDVKPDMSIYRAKIFGPVLLVIRVPDLARAIALVHAHELGN
jgi:malonate-semialdehyde dehydrogenase (acetylating)/methylmalonate-semialdehyde dehydrogenase